MKKHFKILTFKKGEWAFNIGFGRVSNELFVSISLFKINFSICL